MEGDGPRRPVVRAHAKSPQVALGAVRLLLIELLGKGGDIVEMNRMVNTPHPRIAAKAKIDFKREHAEAVEPVSRDEQNRIGLHGCRCVLSGQGRKEAPRIGEKIQKECSCFYALCAYCASIENPSFLKDTADKMPDKGNNDGQ